MADARDDEIADYHHYNGQPYNGPEPPPEGKRHKVYADAQFHNEHSVNIERLRGIYKMHSHHSSRRSQEWIRVQSPLAIVGANNGCDIGCRVQQLSICESPQV